MFQRRLFLNLFPLIVTSLLLQQGLSFTTKTHASQLPNGSGTRSESKLKLRPLENPVHQRRPCLTSDRNFASKTRLFMYNLPPGNNNNNGPGDILKGALGLVLVIGFFASPLGGLVLGLFNSFLVLSLVLPAIGTLVFQGWQYFNTISGTCPNCGAPARVLKTNKEGEASPSLCFNCGAVLQANYENTAIDNVTGRKSVMDDNFGSPSGGSIFDIFGGEPSSYTSTTTTTTTIYEEETPSSKKKSNIKKDMIIDAEIEDDLPFQ